MSSPTFFTEGSTPRPKDALWRIEQKILGALIDGGGSGGGTRQFFVGAGAPAGVQAGQTLGVPAQYFDTNPGGLVYVDALGNGTWI